MTLTTNRLLSGDFIKGFAIILMVYGHVTHIGTAAEIQKSITSFIYTFHMPLFLIISGFFFKLKSDWTKQISDLVLRIGVPYVVFIIVYLIGLLVIQRIGIQSNNVPPENIYDFFKAVIVHPYGAYWFLHSLLLIQLTIVLCGKFLSFTKIVGELPLIVYCFILFLLLDFSDVVKIRTSSYFMFGYVIAFISSKNIQVPTLPFVLGALIIFALSYFSDGIFIMLSVCEISWCVILFCLLWVIAVKLENMVVIKGISWVGQNTLQILILHALFVVAFKPFGSIFISIDPTGILYSCTVALATVALCILSSLISDKIGLSKYLFAVNSIYRG